MSDTSGSLASVDVSEFGAGQAQSAFTAVSAASADAQSAEIAAAQAQMNQAMVQMNAQISAMQAQLEAMQAQLAQAQTAQAASSSPTGTAIASAQPAQTGGYSATPVDAQPGTLASNEGGAVNGVGANAGLEDDGGSVPQPRILAGFSDGQVGASLAASASPQNAADILANTAAIADLRTDLTGLQSDFGLLTARFDTLGEAVATNADGVRVNRDGAAIAMAMAGTSGLQQGENFALSANYGLFDSAHAFAFSGAARFSESISLNAGLGWGTETGELGARAGVRMGW